MSFLSKIKKKWGYETDTPRCENCRSYRRPGQFLVDSLPRKSPAMCQLGDFITSNAKQLKRMIK
ncbi:hypothetical protein M8A51_25585 [Schlegelella sp. S2-27]|uniref:Uncharacterized protein n=1 Tax=Caldimonas mangrovi TaxID=2944811 RepID=A0ABT0YX45_9BURK|nr:hypothetical protein [Caldimonas mangrovi]MCM5682909.1 hypothetical protein [Caldimonas mangrovi]